MKEVIELWEVVTIPLHHKPNHVQQIYATYSEEQAKAYATRVNANAAKESSRPASLLAIARPAIAEPAEHPAKSLAERLSAPFDQFA